MSALNSKGTTCALLITMLSTSSALAQTITIASINPMQSDIGTLVSPASGNTIFRLSPDGSILKLSGQGSRKDGGMTPMSVTLTCTGNDNCESAEATVTIAAMGSPLGRASALSAFTVAPGPNPPAMDVPVGNDTITFTVTGIPRDQTRNFYIGADFTLTATGNTGEASADFIVSVPAGSRNGSIRATTWRPISLAKITDLNFGRIIPPANGSGSVLLDAETGMRYVSGSGVIAITTPAPSLAEFQVTGEGGQSFAIDVPSSFTMSGPGEELTVTTNNDAGANPILSGTTGSAGDYQFRVGGSFAISDTTPPGDYTGSFRVTILYN